MSRKWKDEEELNEAIRLLMHRIDSLTAKSVTRDIESDSVNIEVQELSFQNTIREIFGLDSQEFVDFGSVCMLRDPLRVGALSLEIAKARFRGRDYMVQICVELITRLQQKILQLRRNIESVVPYNHKQDNLHPSIHGVTQHLVADGHFWEAVFAASKTLVLHIKSVSGHHDLDGVNLMRKVFSKNNPVLKFNLLSTSTDFDEQEGMMHLYEGAVMMLRNPGAHNFPTGSDLRAIQYIQGAFPKYDK